MMYYDACPTQTAARSPVTFRIIDVATGNLLLEDRRTYAELTVKGGLKDPCGLVLSGLGEQEVQLQGQGDKKTK